MIQGSYFLPDLGIVCSNSSAYFLVENPEKQALTARLDLSRNNIKELTGQVQYSLLLGQALAECERESFSKKKKQLGRVSNSLENPPQPLPLDVSWNTMKMLKNCTKIQEKLFDLTGHQAYPTISMIYVNGWPDMVPFVDVKEGLPLRLSNHSELLSKIFEVIGDLEEEYGAQKIVFSAKYTCAVALYFLVTAPFTHIAFSISVSVCLMCIGFLFSVHELFCDEELRVGREELSDMVLEDTTNNPCVAFFYDPGDVENTAQNTRIVFRGKVKELGEIFSKKISEASKNDYCKRILHKLRTCKQFGKQKKQDRSLDLPSTSNPSKRGQDTKS